MYYGWTWSLTESPLWDLLLTEYYSKQKSSQGSERYRARLVRAFKQQFSVFLKIRVGKKVCGNMCNVV